MSNFYCRSCRQDMEFCRCATTFHWTERVAAKRAREAREAKQAADDSEQSASEA